VEYGLALLGTTIDVVSSAQTRVESESALGRVEEKEEEVGEGKGEVRMGKTSGKIWMN
jgi:hypothetical protein